MFLRITKRIISECQFILLVLIAMVAFQQWVIPLAFAEEQSILINGSLLDPDPGNRMTWWSKDEEYKRTSLTTPNNFRGHREVTWNKYDVNIGAEMTIDLGESYSFKSVYV